MDTDNRTPEAADPHVQEAPHDLHHMGLAVADAGQMRHQRHPGGGDHVGDDVL